MFGILYQWRGNVADIHAPPTSLHRIQVNVQHAVEGLDCWVIIELGFDWVHYIVTEAEDAELTLSVSFFDKWAMLHCQFLFHIP